MATVDENTFFEQTFDFGITAKVVADDPGSYDSPRDNDTAGRLLLSHRRYTLGDDEKKLGFKFRFDDFGSWAEVEKFLRDEHDAFVVLPVSATDHGGLHVYVGSPRDQWDSGRLGLAYMTRKEATSGWPELAGDDLLGAAVECLRAEVEEYADWLAGNVYGWVVSDKDGETLESCWGYIGDAGRDAAKDEAVSSAAYFVKQQQPRRDQYAEKIAAARAFLATCPPLVRAVAEEGLMLLARREGV